ncbi:luciferin sulfotransferase-like isoform X1 [Penaeus monodon]|uniref:luciferin sulfotransferase-like isoform X1 n=2 Tax=Penaeus monodon TaxID=6687 RepID=UPI0018A7AC18|nr:luciferin sulfotransferase-like isoform X1 [Penaeus monodon]
MAAHKMPGFSVAPVEGPLGDKLRKELTSGFYKDFVAIQPGGHIMPSFYPAWHGRYAQFSVKKDDVWVITYPKSGTTWTQELAWCLLHGRETEAGKQGLMRRFPFFEFDSLMPDELETPPDQDPFDPCLPGNTWKIMHTMAEPRTIKAHLQKPLLPTQLWSVKPKILYVCRDPRDVCISYYFHSVKLDGYTGQLEDFVELFLEDMITWSPFWSHVLDFWRMRHENYILFLRFEEMKEDLPAVVRKVANFLGKAVTEEEVEKLADHCSFGSMSMNKAVNNEDIIAPSSERTKNIKFMRKGQVGDWKNHLTEEQVKAFKAWTMKHLQDSDFPYYRDYE